MKTCFVSLFALSSVAAFAPASQQRTNFPSLSASAALEVENPDAPLDPFDAFGPESEEIAVRETVVGTGETVGEGDVVTVKYEARLFESQVKFSAPDAIPVKLGNGQLVKGFEQALAGKKVGSKYTVRIPSKLAWGNRGKESNTTGRMVIPPGADVEFEVEVLSNASGFMGELELFGKDRAFGLIFFLTLR